MKIVILDGYTLNPGDLSWQPLQAMGDCTIYDRTDRDDIVPRAENADVVLTNKTVLDREILSKLPKLKYIGILATGVNVVDTEFAREKGVIVTNARNYTGRSAAQLVFAFILELAHRVGHHSQSVSLNRWSESPDFCYWDYPLIELEGKTMGIIGFGGIGRHVATIADAFGMEVMVSTRTVPQPPPDGIQFCDMDTIFDHCDVITLHCPLTQATEGLINAARLKQMKNNAYLINISRGQLIVEADLADALNNDVIAGAGLDVLSVEPADPECPLLNAKHCFITPHFAWATYESRARLLGITVDNLQAFLEDTPQNVVN